MTDKYTASYAVAGMSEEDRSKIFINESELRGHGKDWWDSPEEVAATEAMLVRAGVLERPYVEGGPIAEEQARELNYYRSKPWKWTRERAVARILERTFEMAGIPVDVAWEMTGQELMAATQRRDAKRGLR